MISENDSSRPSMESESPRHGYRGETPSEPQRRVPLGLTIAISRESGARGGTIGQRVARKLKWQAYDQDLLEFLSQQGNLLHELDDELKPVAEEWVLQRIETLAQRKGDMSGPTFEQTARVPLCLACLGNVVVIGRGAGFLLPHDTTLHVRMIAPLKERIAYLGQWLRLTSDEAAERARQMDVRREQFLHDLLGDGADPSYEYDLVLCSSRLGEDLCVDLIYQAALGKIRQRWGDEALESGAE